MESVGYIFVAESVGLSLFKFSWWAPKKRLCIETERIMTLQGHQRSTILALIESAYGTSYWFSIVTLVLSCGVSEILEFCVYADSIPHPHPGQNFGGVPFEADL